MAHKETNALRISGQKSSLGKLYDVWVRPYLNQLLAREISRVARYSDGVYQVLPRPEDDLRLMEALDCSKKVRLKTISEVSVTSEDCALFLLHGNFNHDFDVQKTLQELKEKMNRHSRLCAVVYNSYWRWLYIWANKLGVRNGDLPSTFLTNSDIQNLAEISGWSVVRLRPVGFFPFYLGGLGDVINGLLQATPILRKLGFAEVVVLRPIIASTRDELLTVVIPARNERGNIENALLRMPHIEGVPIEVIFVEGHSNDKTWEEIQRVIPHYKHKWKLSAYRQTGKGKADAVRLGFSKASGDILTILDADLTMPPELLPRFVHAYRMGKADFVNGSRLLYPMEGEAMRFLNWLGNRFFAASLSWVLDANLGDSLCGTKLVRRKDYDRFLAWRKDFGDFDPFGDFELLFPAASLALGTVDIPIRYRARTYGSTNILRFRHGLMLLKMTWIGFLKIRAGLWRVGR